MTSVVIEKLGIRGKLLVMIMTTCIFSLSITIVIDLFIGTKNIKRQIIVDVEGYAAIISANSRAAISFNDNERTQRTLETLNSVPSVTKACVVNHLKFLKNLREKILKHQKGLKKYMKYVKRIIKNTLKIPRLDQSKIFF